MQNINWQNIDFILENSFKEDVGAGDVTTAAMTETAPQCSAQIISKQEGIIAGLKIATKAFRWLDRKINIEQKVEDGELVTYGQPLVKLSGNGASILSAERIALNILGRCSGIANQTQKFVKAVAGTNATILDTRKTAPLLRELDKYAVRAGGGKNHRTGLYDMILIKENHIRFAGGLEAALENALFYRQQHNPSLEIEIETTNLDEFARAQKFPIERIMLDNFKLEEMREAVAARKNNIKIEASGGVNLDTVRAIAETGVDYISVGALSHTVTNFDLSLLFDH